MAVSREEEIKDLTTDRDDARTTWEDARTALKEAFEWEWSRLLALAKAEQELADFIADKNALSRDEGIPF